MGTLTTRGRWLSGQSQDSHRKEEEGRKQGGRCHVFCFNVGSLKTQQLKFRKSF